MTTRSMIRRAERYLEYGSSGWGWPRWDPAHLDDAHDPSSVSGGATTAPRSTSAATSPAVAALRRLRLRPLHRARGDD